MNNYNYEKIDRLLQPLMKMMQEEFPNNCKLIIKPHFAQIIYEHDEMTFSSDEMKKPLGETKPMKEFSEMVRSFIDRCEENANIDDLNKIIQEMIIDGVFEQDYPTEKGGAE